MAFRVLVDEDAHAFLNSLDAKSRRIVRDKLETLKENPYPGSDGDKEKIHTGKNRTLYRMHVGRSLTVIYVIDQESAIVCITHILPIEKAHRRYGRM